MNLNEEKLKQAQDAYNKLVEKRSEMLKDAENVAGEKIEETRSAIEKINSEIDNAKKSYEDIKYIIEQERNALSGLKPKNEEENKMTTRDALLHYVTRAEDSASAVASAEDGKLVSKDGEVLIPVDIQTKAEHEVKTVTDLAKLVRRVSVTTASGSHPVLKRADALMHTVEELEKNPDLAKPKFEKVAYKVQTYRGQIAVSEESIEDSQGDILDAVATNAEEQRINTTNKLVADKLKGFTAKQASSADDIKHILNVDLDPAYNATIIASPTFYNWIDTLKDKNDRYLFNESLTEAGKGTLLGVPVVRVSKGLLGGDDDAVAFIGDPESIVYFDRKNVTLKWTDNAIYGQLLAVAFRADVEVADQKAGYFVTAQPSK